jgi:putative transposase
MIDRDHELPLRRQAEVLQLSRSTLYYEPRPVPAADLAVMRRIDELHLDYPFAGSRMMRDLLRGEGIAIGRERVVSMMQRMGIEALYRRPNTSKPAVGHKIYPYLLRGLDVVRPNQVWAMDITYIPMARGFVYLTAVLDWFSRRVLSWRVSITLEVEFCLDAVEEARQARPAGDFQHRPGQPIHQRRLHRPAAWERHRDQHGRPRCLARQRVRRAALAFSQVRGGVLASLRQRRRGARLDRPVSGVYNRKRPHSSLDARTPDQAYFDHLPQRVAA